SVKLRHPLGTVDRLAGFKPHGAEHSGQQRPVVLDIVHHERTARGCSWTQAQHTAGNLSLLEKGRVIFISRDESNRKLEYAALSQLAAHRDVPSHEPHELPADGQ